MATLLLHILARLRSENLHGPTSPYPPNAAAGRARPLSETMNTNRDSWILLDDEFGDMDSKDPRWPELFLEFFVEGGAEGNDDLLFFVKQSPAADGSNGSSAAHAQDGGSDVHSDPLLVRRKVGKTMPALDHVIDWKQTFFLNLIVQLPCTLTVAVCSRGGSQSAAGKQRKSSLLENNASQERILGSSTNSLATAGGNATSSPTSTEAPSGDFPSTPVASTSTASLSSPRPAKSKMVALQRIPKTVYAAPYKSRMDVKDAFMNEPSYPAVYYTVNDYESHDLHLSIRENEYLCVELSVIMPADPAIATRDGKKWSATTGTDHIASISVEDDPAPFPVPKDCLKIVIFQGAVPYTSLLDIYEQKGLAARNQLRGVGWKKLAEQAAHTAAGHASGAGGRKGDGPSPLPEERTEYIMMRGPHGKGQCQVAIQDLPPPSRSQPPSSASDADPASADSSVSSPSSVLSPSASPSSSIANNGATPPRKPATTLTDRLFKFGNVVKSQIATLAAPDARNGDPHGDGHRKPESLSCSMTYVNVPWQSIISHPLLSLSLKIAVGVACTAATGIFVTYACQYIIRDHNALALRREVRARKRKVLDLLVGIECECIEAVEPQIQAVRHLLEGAASGVEERKEEVSRRSRGDDAARRRKRAHDGSSTTTTALKRQSSTSSVTSSVHSVLSKDPVAAIPTPSSIPPSPTTTSSSSTVNSSHPAVDRKLAEVDDTLLRILERLDAVHPADISANQDTTASSEDEDVRRIGDQAIETVRQRKKAIVRRAQRLLDEVDRLCGVAGIPSVGTQHGAGAVATAV
ncbi:hypothetical protein HKX48_005242 [Thoreauomyces humboldtii]|nr:hypothetical protein HKX48_005242 [Thoreauomyces humboldtii]